MSKVLRETMPTRTGIGLLDLSAANVIFIAATAKIDNTERRRRANRRVSLVGLSIERHPPLRADRSGSTENNATRMTPQREEVWSNSKSCVTLDPIDTGENAETVQAAID